MAKMHFFYAGTRRGKDCDARDAVMRELDVMTTYHVQQVGNKRRKNKLMLELIRRKQKGISRKFVEWYLLERKNHES